MPFDATEFDAGAVAFGRFREQPSLEGLSYALRHPEVWPEGFVWEFGDCNRCAMGLAHELTDAVADTVRWRATGRLPFDWTSASLNIPREVASRLFGGKGTVFGDTPWSLIEPAHVADAIDAYLATR